MKCLVINLDRSRDRLAHMTVELARIGVAFERVAAIDACNPSDMAATAPYRNSFPSNLSDAEIACFLSHIACWRIVAESNDAYAAILEDDVLISAVARPLFADSDWIPADADIVKLETVFSKTSVSRIHTSVGYGHSVSRLLGAHLGTAGYIVSKRAARDLIEATYELAAQVDCVMFDPAFQTSWRKTTYQLIPALCMQTQFLSDDEAVLPSQIIDATPRALATPASEKRKRSTPEKVLTEVKRTWHQASKVFQLEREMIIPFRYHGKSVRPPRPGHRLKAL